MDKYDKIREMKSLFDSGLISESEFSVLKNELLFEDNKTKRIESEINKVSETKSNFDSRNFNTEPVFQTKPYDDSIKKAKDNSEKTVSSKKTISNILVILGLTLLTYAFFMDTSVKVDYPNGNQYGFPDRVNNLGLMADRQNFMIIGAIITIGGCILYYSETNKKE
jgi:hypothetical protein